MSGLLIFLGMLILFPLAMWAEEESKNKFKKYCNPPVDENKTVIGYEQEIGDSGVRKVPVYYEDQTDEEKKRIDKRINRSRFLRMTALYVVERSKSISEKQKEFLSKCREYNAKLKYPFPPVSPKVYKWYNKHDRINNKPY